MPSQSSRSYTIVHNYFWPPRRLLHCFTATGSSIHYTPLDRQPDAALIARYVAVRDEEAFRELVRRHGPMVLCTCARMLRHRQDAEDAFQAVFAILAARRRIGHAC